MDTARAELNGAVVLPYHRVYNALGICGVQLLRRRTSSTPLTQTQSQERMVLKVSVWPDMPAVILAGRRSLDLPEALQATPMELIAMIRTVLGLYSQAGAFDKLVPDMRCLSATTFLARKVIHDQAESKHRCDTHIRRCNMRSV